MSTGRMQQPRSSQDRRKDAERRLTSRSPGADRRLGFDRREHLVTAVPFDPAMHPRYQDGESIIVDPYDSAEIGDEVLVSLSDGRRMVRKITASDALTMTLEPVNGAAEVVLLADVQSLLLVVGRTQRRRVTTQGGAA